MIERIIISIFRRFYEVTGQLPLEGEVNESCTGLSEKGRLDGEFFKAVFRRGLVLPPITCSLTTLQDFKTAFPEDNVSVIGSIHPELALDCQDETGAEIAFDLILDIYQQEIFGLVTRGFNGVAGSDQLFYYLLSPIYKHFPVFHTHPSVENEIGRYRPSKADITHITNLHRRLGKRPVHSMVLFPDRKYTIYGVTGKSRYFEKPGLPFKER